MSATYWPEIASISRKPSQIDCMNSDASTCVIPLSFDILSTLCSALCRNESVSAVFRMRSFFSCSNLRYSRSIIPLFVSLSCSSLRRASSSEMHVVAIVPSTRRHETVLSITGLIIIDTSYLYTVD